MPKRLMNIRIEEELLQIYQGHSRTRGETFTSWCMEAMKLHYLKQANPLKNAK